MSGVLLRCELRFKCVSTLARRKFSSALEKFTRESKVKIVSLINPYACLRTLRPVSIGVISDRKRKWPSRW